MANLINKPEEIVFRQTFNVTWKRWEAPKRLTPIKELNTKTVRVDRKEVWRRVDNVDNLINKKNGIGMALWRLQNIMNKLCDTKRRVIWKTVMSERKRVTIGSNLYSIWTLTCTRIKRDMSGVM